jgi:hypothetical protein
MESGKVDQLDKKFAKNLTYSHRSDFSQTSFLDEEIIVRFAELLHDDDSIVFLNKQTYKYQHFCGINPLG